MKNSAIKKEIKINDSLTIQVVKKNISTSQLVAEGIISEKDAEMDKRAKIAVSAEKKKARVCKKPIAVYDKNTKRAYLVETDERKVKIG